MVTSFSFTEFPPKGAMLKNDKWFLGADKMAFRAESLELISLLEDSLYHTKTKTYLHLPHTLISIDLKLYNKQIQRVCTKTYPQQ